MKIQSLLELRPLLRLFRLLFSQILQWAHLVVQLPPLLHLEKPRKKDAELSNNSFLDNVRRYVLVQEVGNNDGLQLNN